MTPEQHLTHGLRLEQAGERAAALISLVELWQATRSPLLAKHIEALSSAIEDTLPPVDVASASSVSKAIATRMKNSTALDVGPLITAIARATKTFPRAYSSLVALASRHPDDPRLASALYAMIQKPPFSGTRGALYSDLVLALEKTRDPRYVPEIVDWSTELETRRRFIRKEKKDLDQLRDAAARVQKLDPPMESPWMV